MYIIIQSGYENWSHFSSNYHHRLFFLYFFYFSWQLWVQFNQHIFNDDSITNFLEHTIFLLPPLKTAYNSFIKNKKKVISIFCEPTMKSKRFFVRVDTNYLQNFSYFLFVQPFNNTILYNCPLILLLTLSPADLFYFALLTRVLLICRFNLPNTPTK